MVVFARRMAMAYTVKQVAAVSGVSVRALRFYDQTGLLAPAHVGANGYRFYEEPQLLRLQQILFYRELGFKLKQIKPILGQADFEIASALQSHQQLLQHKVARTHRLIETIDKTMKHLKGTKKMKTEEMFVGFSVGRGKARFDEEITLGGEPNDCKVSAQDTGGAMCVFEFTGSGGGPPHLHHEQDEWIYVLDGEFAFQVGEKRLRLSAGESIFLPRKVPHVWASVGKRPGKVINTYQPAGKMESFFRAVGSAKNLPTEEDVINKTYTEEQVKFLHQLFSEHGLKLLGPPMLVE
jgi:DNA-binding transcriptional MerR regulator